MYTASSSSLSSSSSYSSSSSALLKFAGPLAQGVLREPMVARSYFPGGVFSPSLPPRADPDSKSRPADRASTARRVGSETRKRIFMDFWLNFRWSQNESIFGLPSGWLLAPLGTL